jgi:hypothetical protein
MKRVLKDTKDSKKIFKDMGMNKWREVPMPKLRKGDRFRIYSQAGRPLELGGEETLVAQSDAFQVEGVWAVEIN